MPRFRQVVGELHAQQQVVHVRTKRLFDAPGHFRRERSLAVEEVGERGAVLIRSPGWGGVFIGIRSSAEPTGAWTWVRRGSQPADARGRAASRPRDSSTFSILAWAAG